MKTFRLPPVIRKALGTASKIASAVGKTVRPFLNKGLKKLSALSAAGMVALLIAIAYILLTNAA